MWGSMDTEEQILERFLTDLNDNRLILPTLPEVALKVRDEVEKDNCNAAEIAKIIGMDAALSARLLQVCNSPLYRGPSMIVWCATSSYVRSVPKYQTNRLIE